MRTICSIPVFESVHFLPADALFMLYRHTDFLLKSIDAFSTHLYNDILEI